MASIYILTLENNKYYVGKTKNIINRVNDHINGKGSIWTRMHKPIDILDIVHNCGDFDEDVYTLRYMANFGIDNVRGGTFCQPKLLEQEIQIIQKMIRSAENKCYNCGSDQHFMHECPIECSENESPKIELHPDSPKKENAGIGNTNRCPLEIYKQGVTCFRCGKLGHYANECV